MIPGTVCIHPVSPDHPGRDRAAADLTETEKRRAASFRSHEDAARWAFFRSALRRILGDALGMPARDVPLVTMDSGKPVLAHPFEALHFSLSHCNDLALVALTGDGPVGIDLEPVLRAPELSGCETTFCHPLEIAFLPAEINARSLRLLELWTAKEALLKALGTGFSHPPETVRIQSHTASSDTPLPGIGNQVIHRLHHPSLASHCAALSAPRSIRRLEFVP